MAQYVIEGVTLQDIADSIRTKTGDSGLISTIDFATKILSIQGGGGTGEGTGFGNLKITTGQFHTGEDNVYVRTIEHGLGVMPDMVIVLNQKWMAEDDPDFGKYTIQSIIGVHSKICSAFDIGGNYYVAYGLGATYDCSERSLDKVDDTIQIGRLFCRDDNTFEVGTVQTSSDNGRFATNATYTWVAISGMGGAIGGGSAEGFHDVTFMNGDVHLLTRPVYDGDDCPDPVTQERIDKPTKESTVDTVYTHNGWAAQDGSIANKAVLENIEEDRTVFAAFKSDVRKYTVRFFDGNTLLKTEQVEYGGSSDYVYQKGELMFNGWTPEPTNIAGDMDCYGEWIDKPTFANSSWETIAAVSESGQAASVFNVGDTRDITVTYANGTTETITLEIAGFDQLYTVYDGSGLANHETAGLAIVAKTPLATDRRMDEAKGSYFGFDTPVARDCELRTWANNEFYNALPADFSAVLKDQCCVKGFDIFDKESEYIKVMIPTYEHMFESGSQLTLYETQTNRVKKKYGSDTAVTYWVAGQPLNTTGAVKCYAVATSGAETYRDLTSAIAFAPMFAI